MTTKRWSRPVGLAVLAGLAYCGVSFAYIWSADHGAWSSDWPKELEPYRERTSTITTPNPPVGKIVYTIPFADRSDFEKIWPVLLNLKTKGAPLILRSGSVELRRSWSAIDLNREEVDKPAGTYPGVKIYTSGHSMYPENSPAYASSIASEGQPTAKIELFVDGNVIDLNRIRLPAETPIIDKRVFENEQKQPTTKPSN